MGVVDHNGERLAAVDSLKATGNVSQGCHSVGDRMAAATSRRACGRGSKNVVYIHASDQRREDGDLIFRPDKIEARAPRSDLHIRGVKVSANPAIAQNLRAMLATELNQ